MARPSRTGCHPYGAHIGMRPAAANLGVRSTFGQQARRVVRAGRGPMPESAPSGHVRPRHLKHPGDSIPSASLQGIPLADYPAPLGTAKFMQPMANDGPDYYLLYARIYFAARSLFLLYVR